MKKVYFVTSNPGKVEIMNGILTDLSVKDVKIKMLDYDAPEDKSSGDVEVIASLCAKHCAEKFNKEILTTDGGLFIDILNGFPGINIGDTLRTKGVEYILELMKGKENRKAYYQLATAYCVPGQEPKSFVSKADFIVAQEVRRSFGFGFDKIMVPVGYTQTLSENKEVRDKVLPYRQNFIDFLKWYNEASSSR